MRPPRQRADLLLVLTLMETDKRPGVLPLGDAHPLSSRCGVNTARQLLNALRLRMKQPWRQYLAAKLPQHGAARPVPAFCPTWLLLPPDLAVSTLGFPDEAPRPLHSWV